MTMLDNYYRLRPLIPRRLQIALRRSVAKRKLNNHRSVWPIDRAASKVPEGWLGWPDDKQFALVLNHDVDTVNGLKKCARLKEAERRLNFRSSFYFVPEGYEVPASLRRRLKEEGSDVGVHGLLHDGKMFRSRKIFEKRAARINFFMKEWEAVGFSSPSMHRNLEWMGELDISYDLSTFDTDPFEPHPKGTGTIFPNWIASNARKGGFVELPYTLPQDHTLFIILEEKDNRIWKEKLDWIAENRGMALINTHPDYMNFGSGKNSFEEYPASHYLDFLKYARARYEGRFWNALSKEMAEYWANKVPTSPGKHSVVTTSREAQIDPAPRV